MGEHARTDGRTTRKLNAAGQIYWIGGVIKMEFYRLIVVYVYNTFA